MNKKTLSVVLCAFYLLLALHAAGAAAEEGPADRVSIGGDPARESARSEAIRLALRERGYIEGQNIATEYRYAEGSSIGS